MRISILLLIVFHSSSSLCMSFIKNAKQELCFAEQYVRCVSADEGVFVSYASVIYSFILLLHDCWTIGAATTAATLATISAKNETCFAFSTHFFVNIFLGERVIHIHSIIGIVCFLLFSFHFCSIIYALLFSRFVRISYLFITKWVTVEWFDRNELQSVGDRKECVSFGSGGFELKFKFSIESNVNGR